MVYGLAKLTFHLNVYLGLAFSLLMTLCSLILIVLNYLTIRETVAGPGDGVRPIVFPLVAKFFKRDLSPLRQILRQFEISYLTPIFTLFLSSWTWMAYGFARLDPSAYAHPERLSYGLMLEHYLWQAVDMVPLVETWKSLHIDDPLMETRIWPGILVIGFRLIVLYMFFAQAAKLFGLNQRKKSAE